MIMGWENLGSGNIVNVVSLRMCLRVVSCFGWVEMVCVEVWRVES